MVQPVGRFKPFKSSETHSFVAKVLINRRSHYRFIKVLKVPIEHVKVKFFVPFGKHFFLWYRVVNPEF